MALAITTSLIGAQSPQAVQVVVTGATAGDAYTITGSWSGGQWIVRGGDSTIAADTQIVLVDIAAPLNVLLTYTVTHDANGASASSGLATVPHPDEEVLTSVDGLQVVRFLRRLNDGAPRNLIYRSQTFRIPGRQLAGVRFDVTGGETGSMSVDTIDEDTVALFGLLRAGGLVLHRTDGSIRDTPAVQWLLILDSPSQLDGIDDARTWTLSYEVVDDPQPDIAVSVDTWDDFDTVYVASAWTADFDPEWSGQTWNLFDVEDWATR